MRSAVGAAVCLLAGAAGAQTMTYFWTVTTDDGDTDVQPGERAYLGMWAHMDPQAAGFASTYFEIRGLLNWDQGEVVKYDCIYEGGPPFDEGDLQPNNDILSIESFQGPPLFDPDFNADNPILLYVVWWVPNDYSQVMEVEVGDANHLNNDVWTDEFGTSVGYEGIPGVARFTVNVPGPGVVAVLGVAGMWRGRRRTS